MYYKLEKEEMPTNSNQVRFERARHIIDELFNLKELEAQGYAVDELLNKYGLRELVDSLILQGVETFMGADEAYYLLSQVQWEDLGAVPFVESVGFDGRQLEEAGGGRMVDVSVYNTMDVQRGQLPFDRYSYKLNKITEKVKNYALLHSCISYAEGKELVKKQCLSLLHANFGFELDHLKLTLKKVCGPTKREELLEKISKHEKQIKRLTDLWNTVANST